ncbi:MAG: ASKHA domain-containing protein [Thermodesulfobacteriota bacterium]
MNKYRILFLPDLKEIEIEEGASLLEAAKRAGIYIQSLCGGEGVCGKCRLQVVQGKSKIDPSFISFFTKGEIEKGYVLACQTPIKEDLKVVVPPESRMEEGQILKESYERIKERWSDTPPLQYSEVEWISLFKRPSDPASLFEPLTQKVFLELQKPTIEDNIPDTARMVRELRKKLKFQSYRFSLSSLKELSIKLRRSDWKVTLTLARDHEMGKVLQIEEGNRSDQNYGVAVDVGTTTVVAQLVDLKTGKVIGVEGNHNLQAHYGEDVLSRIAYVCGRGSLEVLQKAVVENINLLIQTLSKTKGVDPEDISSLVAAGNTTMSHLLMGLMPCSIREDPYVPTVDLYPQIMAKEIGIHINPHGIVEVLPSVASYIGGDTVAGVLACQIADRPELTCLIDIGTNGEIVIGNNEWLLSCSASAGPAFEGGDTKWGMRATKGAIQRIDIEKGEVFYETIGKEKPRGICGSGFIDLIYGLTKNRILEIDGKFSKSFKDRRLIKVGPEVEYIVAFPEETEKGEAITITQSDIDNILRSKAAVFAAIKSLMDYAGLTFDDLKKIYVAGGFGNYLNIEKAIGIGLLPDLPIERFEFVGNSSLMGARMVLLSYHAFEKAIAISQSITNIELSKFAPFAEEYMASLYLPHIDQERLFPSVKY